MAVYKQGNTFDTSGNVTGVTETPNWYSDKAGSYGTVGGIVPVLVNDYSDNIGTIQAPHYANRGYLYCDGASYNIRDYPLLYEIVGNDYLTPTELIDSNSYTFTATGESGSIFRTFIDGTDIYAEVYKYEYTPPGATTALKQRAIPHESRLRFVSSLGSFPAGSNNIFEADKDYLLEYNPTYQNLSTRQDTTVHRILVNQAISTTTTTVTTTVQVNWTISSGTLIVPSGTDQYYILPIEYYGTVPEAVPGSINAQTGLPYLSGYTSYEPNALNYSPEFSWGNLTGMPDGVDIDSYEIFLQNMSLQDMVQWHVTGIPSTVTSLQTNAVLPTGAVIQPNTVSQSSVQPPAGTPASWIRDSGYAGPQPEGGEKHLYRFNVIAKLSNGQDLIQSLDFTAGSGALIPTYSGNPNYTNNLTITGVTSNVTDNIFNIEWGTLGPYTKDAQGNVTGHPKTRIRKPYSQSDYPYLLGTFRVPDYRDRKLIGYGEGVEGAGTPLVEARATIKVGDTGGKWYIPTTTIDDPAEFFTISDVVTSGYGDIQTQIQAYLTGEKKFVVGPIQDYVFNRPASHDHQILRSEVDEQNEVSLGGLDRFTTSYRNIKGTVSSFIPGTSDEIALGHAHGLTSYRPSNSSTSTYGNTAGIGEFTASSSGTIGQESWTTPGSHTWTAPTDVTSVCVVAVGGGAGGAGGTKGGGGAGLGYTNNITVVPGQTYNLFVGAGATGGAASTGDHPGQDSYFIDSTTCLGKGGGTSTAGDSSSYGTFVGDGGGNGDPSSANGGGGGAGGYALNQGGGGTGTDTDVTGGGAGGGGVGLKGQGSTGADGTPTTQSTQGGIMQGGRGGSGGTNGGNTIAPAEQNATNPTPAIGQQAFTTPGTFDWVAPAGVTEVDVVAVGGGSGGGQQTNGGAGGGLGYKNAISVTPGNTYQVIVGAGGAGSVNTLGAAGEDSYFIDANTVKGGGGTANGTGGTYAGAGGGVGGAKTQYGSGGGAAGYQGNGGGGTVVDGSGGGAGAGAAFTGAVGGGAGGGGVGITGMGASGSSGNPPTTSTQNAMMLGGGAGSGGNTGGNTTSPSLSDSWVLTGGPQYPFWSSFMHDYAIYKSIPANNATDPFRNAIQGNSHTFNVTQSGNLSIEVQSDNEGTVSWDGVALGGGGVEARGQAEFTTAGSQNWTAPAGVTSVSVVAVGAGQGGGNDNSGGGGGGLGYKNNITVVPGQSYTVVVGQAGSGTTGSQGNVGGDSYFINTTTVKGGGGNNGVGGTYVGDGGGVGGGKGSAGGGGGAAGYSGSGGSAANANGQGGGGGVGSSTTVTGTGAGSGGGGVGIKGQGSSGAGGSPVVQNSASSAMGGGQGGSGGTAGTSITSPSSSSGATPTPAVGQAEWTTPGTYTWTCPAGVTEVCSVAVGGGAGGVNNSSGGGGGLAWRNAVQVTPGQTYTIVVGAGGAGSSSGSSTNANRGGDSYFIDITTCRGGGGGWAAGGLVSTGGGYVGQGGDSGNTTAAFQGGGGAGGYTAGNTGGGGGTGAGSKCNFGGAGGGGVGIYGQGASGNNSIVSYNCIPSNYGRLVEGGTGGSGGADGQDSPSGMPYLSTSHWERSGPWPTDGSWGSVNYWSQFMNDWAVCRAIPPNLNDPYPWNNQNDPWGKIFDLGATLNQVYLDVQVDDQCTVGVGKVTTNVGYSGIQWSLTNQNQTGTDGRVTYNLGTLTAGRHYILGTLTNIGTGAWNGPNPCGLAWIIYTNPNDKWGSLILSSLDMATSTFSTHTDFDGGNGGAIGGGGGACNIGGGIPAGAGYIGGDGGDGAVRIIWGTGRSFPSTLTTDQTTQAYSPGTGTTFGSVAGGPGGGYGGGGGAGYGGTSPYEGGAGGMGAVRIIWGSNRSFPSTSTDDVTTQSYVEGNPSIVNSPTTSVIYDLGNVAAGDHVVGFTCKNVGDALPWGTNPAGIAWSVHSTGNTGNRLQTSADAVTSAGWTSYAGGDGGTIGGGGGGGYNLAGGDGGDGAVRIMWGGTGRQYPLNAFDQTPQAYNPGGAGTFTPMTGGFGGEVGGGGGSGYTSAGGKGGDGGVRVIWGEGRSYPSNAADETGSTGGCLNYKITEAPSIAINSVDSDGTKITCVTSVDHGFAVGDWITFLDVGTGYNGTHQIIAEGYNTNTFKVEPNSAPVAGSGDTTGKVREAAGYFTDVTTIPDPKVWTVDATTRIGGKPIVSTSPDDYEPVVGYEAVLTSSGTITKSLASGTDKVRRYKILLVAPGGGGGGSQGNGATGGNASVTFDYIINGVKSQYTVYAYGGVGGTAGNSGGAGGAGGGFLVPAALVSDPNFSINTQLVGNTGTNGGSPDQSTPQGGIGYTQGNAILVGQGGNGAYSTTPNLGSFQRNFTSNGSFNAATDPSVPAGSAVVYIDIDASGGAGGDGNSQRRAGCESQSYLNSSGSTQTGVGGTGGQGRRVTGRTSNSNSFTFTVGTQGGQGYNNVEGTNSEPRNNNVGTGAASGGYGGSGAWGNGSAAGAGGGATSVQAGGGFIIGAAGGGGGGAGGGGFNGGSIYDKCWTGGPGNPPAQNILSTQSIGFAAGAGGGEGGCTAGGGGGGGAGAGTSGSGGSSGVAGAGHVNTGSGSGGYAGQSAYNSNYITNATESAGSTGDGYVNFTVHHEGNQLDPSGGGGGAGAVIEISWGFEDIDGATDIVATLGNVGNGGTGGNSQSGSAGYIKVDAEKILEGSENAPIGYTEARGNVYEVPGYPDAPIWPATSSLSGGAIWHSASDDVITVLPATGTFPAHSTQASKFIKFVGEGNRFLQMGAFNLSSAEELVFYIIKGDGTNGGDTPEEDLALYYKLNIESPNDTLVQVIASITETDQGWKKYTYTINDNDPIKQESVMLILRQVRPSNSGSDWDDDGADVWGLAEFGIRYGEVTAQVFTPSTNSEIPGNTGTCGPDSGIDVVRKTVSAAQSNIRFTDGTFALSSSTPISISATATPQENIPLVTRYHRAKYLIKAF